MSYKLVLEEAKEEKRAFQEAAFQEEATASKANIPIPHRFQKEPTRLIWSSMAVSKQREELSITITSLAFFLGYPASGRLALSCFHGNLSLRMSVPSCE